MPLLDSGDCAGVLESNGNSELRLVEISGQSHSAEPFTKGLLVEGCEVVCHLVKFFITRMGQFPVIREKFFPVLLNYISRAPPGV